MLSQSIVESDIFLDMPLSTQALYVHLNMNADDDGFVNPRRIMRMIGASNDDLNILLSKRYLLMFPSGVSVIKHWLINNTIRSDRYNQTTYQDELSLLTKNAFGGYTEISKITTNSIDSTDEVDIMATNGKPKDIPMGNPAKSSLVKSSPNTRPANGSPTAREIQDVFDFYVQEFGSSRSHIKLSDSRKNKIKARLIDAGMEMVKEAITRTAKSPFHRGDGQRGWKADLDWIVKSYENVEKMANHENRHQQKGVKI